MDLTAVFKALEASSPAAAIRASLYLFPAIETIHVIALALVFGTILIVDLRLLGLASTARRVHKVEADLLKWTWGGFVVAAVTGLLMFITNAQVYADSLPFRLKLVALALAGLNMVVFEFTTHRSIKDWDDQPRAPTAGRVAAILSILLWTAVIFTGRWIGFTTSHATVELKPPAGVDFDDFLQ